MKKIPQTLMTVLHLPCWIVCKSLKYPKRTQVQILPAFSHTFSRSNIRSRNRYVWATSKGRTSSRTAAINIVRVDRRPTRSVRNMLDPIRREKRSEIRTMPTHVKNKIKRHIRRKKRWRSKSRTARRSRWRSIITVIIKCWPSISGWYKYKKIKICGLCSYKKRRTTKSLCSKCNTAICGEHKVDLCQWCALKI